MLEAGVWDDSRWRKGEVLGCCGREGWSDVCIHQGKLGSYRDGLGLGGRAAVRRRGMLRYIMNGGMGCGERSGPSLLIERPYYFFASQDELYKISWPFSMLFHVFSVSPFPWISRYCPPGREPGRVRVKRGSSVPPTRLRGCRGKARLQQGIQEYPRRATSLAPASRAKSGAGVWRHGLRPAPVAVPARLPLESAPPPP